MDKQKEEKEKREKTKQKKSRGRGEGVPGIYVQWAQKDKQARGRTEANDKKIIIYGWIGLKGDDCLFASSIFSFFLFLGFSLSKAGSQAGMQSYGVNIERAGQEKQNGQNERETTCASVGCSVSVTDDPASCTAPHATNNVPFPRVLHMQ